MRMYQPIALGRLLLVTCLLPWLWNGANPTFLNAEEPAVAETPALRYADRVLADQPVAYWRFDGSQPPKVPNVSGQPGLDAEIAGGVSLQVPGPRPPQWLGFGRENAAARLSGNGSFLRVTDPGENSVLDFDKGDAITLEAWVNPSRLTENQQVYVVGKGRTTNKGFPKENQNYALRLRGVGGTARISFLFRNAKNRAGVRDDFHRWNSDIGFVPGGGWHHIAVTYEFGNPKSIKGYLDGRRVSGTWDYGGATADGPVVDNDELWIGSSMGGAKSGTFAGDLDEIAIYRTALSAEQIARRVWERPLESFLAKRELPKDAVLVEVLEGIPDQKSWSFPPPPAWDAYVTPAFAFLDVPKKYNERGVQIDRTNPFALRATGMITLPDRDCRLLLRARNGARLFLDEKLILESPFHTINGNAHGKIRYVEVVKNDTIRPLATGDNERIVEIRGDGKPHRLRLELFLGGGKKRPELGETSVSLETEDGLFRILSPQESWRHALTDEEFVAFRKRDQLFQSDLNADRRQIAGKKETEFWNHRHQLAKTLLQERPALEVPQVKDSSVFNAVDRFINHRLEAEKKAPAKLTEDWAFLRRVTLDVTGAVPTSEQIESFFADKPDGRRERYIDRLLADPGWADHWVSYWQDVLAENPNIVNPTLNNTGPFRWWIQESFLDNKPFDRFASELIRMEGSRYYGGPGGFEMATQNDVPMAAKAHIIGQAFLGLEMKCARCHDAPFHDFKQADLFQVAAMLNRGPQAVPASSLIPGGDDAPMLFLVTVTLKPGEKLAPQWPFADLASEDLLPTLTPNPGDTRERLAALVTSPQNDRFAKVIVNRLWKRYLGRGFVEPVDDWEDATPSHPELLEYLARELVTNGYDLKHMARLILTSHAYQRLSIESTGNEKTDALFAGPLRRRMTAEQVVDSLFAACGKDFHAGELNIDADGSRQFTSSLNLGHPKRAWEFTSLSNERDRPSLSLPMAQPFLDVLESFGWRASRQDPVTVREDSPTVLQPAVLANGDLGRRFTRCSEDSIFTQLALRDLPLETLIDQVIQLAYTRPSTAQERATFGELLKEGYSQRQREATPDELKIRHLRNAGVSWSNHLSEEANQVQIDLQKAVKRGDPPSPRLESDWRMRYEDMLWALLNSPEFVFVP